MPSVKIFFDTRRAKKDNTYPIKLRIQNRTAFLVSTNMYALDTEFINGSYANNANNAKIKNIALRTRVNKVERYLLELEDSNKIQSLTDKELKTKIEKLLQYDNNERTFIDVIAEYASKCKRPNTASTYLQTLTKIRQYDERATFSTITTEWLDNFVSFLEPLKINSKSIHLRNIRTVFNFAIDNEETILYPFRKYTIENQETAHKALTESQLRDLMHAKLENYQNEYRDVFLLFIYLIGINPIDLFENPTTRIVGNRIEYYRSKRKHTKFYSIKLEPEALAIIKKYKSKNSIINVLHGRNYRTYCLAMNRALKRMSVELPDRVGHGGRKIYKPICNKLSVYYARHTWASVAHRLGIPKDIISEALGHEYGSRETSIYIQFDRSKIDQANRKVIDYLQKL